MTESKERLVYLLSLKNPTVAEMRVVLDLTRAKADALRAETEVEPDYRFGEAWFQWTTAKKDFVAGKYIGAWAALKHFWHYVTPEGAPSGGAGRSGAEEAAHSGAGPEPTPTAHVTARSKKGRK